MMLTSFQDPNMMYTYNQQYYENPDKVYHGHSPHSGASPSTASTWTGDMDSMSSVDSYWENGAMRQNPGAMGYMMQAESVSQDQQRYMVPVPMMQTPFGYVPLTPGAHGGAPMSPSGVPLPAGAPGGVAVMPAVPRGPNSEASSPTSMAPVSPSSPAIMMQQAAAVNGDPSMQGMQPVVMAVIPMGMPMPGMPGMGGMQTIPVQAPPGYMLKNMNEPSPKDQNDGQSPAGDKKPRLLEELLPGGVRRRATREELGRKVFVGGLNPTTTTEDLRAYFSDFGVVTDSCVITDSSSKASRGFGFVEFEGKIPEGLLDQQHIIDQRRCGVREYGHSTSQSS
jgi:hypothetical protein